MNNENLNYEKLDPIAKQINDLSQQLKAKLEELISASKGQIVFDPTQLSVPYFGVGREQVGGAYRIFRSDSTDLANNKIIIGYNLRKAEQKRVRQGAIAAQQNETLRQHQEAITQQQREGLEFKINELQRQIDYQKGEIDRVRGWGPMMDLTPGEGYLHELNEQMAGLRGELESLQVPV